MVRAKFRCDSVKKYRHWDKEKGFLYEYEFSPVGDSSPENKTFWAASPCGSLKLSTINSDLFEVGKEYYLDFTPA